jgi:hypothetical protein
MVGGIPIMWSRKLIGWRCRSIQFSTRREGVKGGQTIVATPARVRFFRMWLVGRGLKLKILDSRK